MADGSSRAIDFERRRRTSSVSIKRAEIDVPNPYTRPASGRFCTVDAEIVDDAPSPSSSLARRLVLLMILVGVAAIATYAWTHLSATSVS